MKKMIKKLLPIILVVSILLTSSLAANAVENKNTDGKKVQFYEDTGVLVVTGNGIIHNLFNESTVYENNYNTKVKYLIIGEGITQIYSSFCSFSALKDISFPETLEYMVNSFKDCDSLTKVTFPSSMKEIASGSFYDCDSITELYFNDGLEEIYCGGSVFRDMDSLESVFIPSGVHLAGAFRYCKNLKTVIFEDCRIGVQPYSLGEGTDDSGYAWCFDNCHEDAVIYVEEQYINSRGYSLEERVSPDISVVYLKSDPINLNATVGTDGINISWDAYAPGKVYSLQRKASGDSKWTKIADTTKNSYTDTGAVSGKTYTYLLKVSGMDESVTSNSVKYLSRPVLKSVVSSSSKTATVKWNKVEGAEGYYVYRSATGEAGTWTRVANIKSGSTTSYTAKDLKKGSDYYFCVKAYSGKTASASSAKKVVTVGEPVISATTSGNDKITVKWNKISDVKYYRVYMKNKGVPSYTTVATIKDPATVSYSKVWKFDSQNTACVRVRAFYKDGTHQISDPIEVGR